MHSHVILIYLYTPHDQRKSLGTEINRSRDCVCTSSKKSGMSELDMEFGISPYYILLGGIFMVNSSFQTILFQSLTYILSLFFSFSLF